MFEFHEEYTVHIRRFKCRDVLFERPNWLLRGEFVLDVEEREAFCDVEQG